MYIDKIQAVASPNLLQLNLFLLSKAPEMHSLDLKKKKKVYPLHFSVLIP